MDHGDDVTVRGLLSRLRDPNTRFPARPRLVPDLQVFRMPDGLGIQFRGGEQPVIVRGHLAEAALDFLLPRLDGSRSLDDFLRAEDSPVPEATLLRALVLLHSKGLLVEEPVASRSAGAGDETLGRQLLFWGRHLDLTRSTRSADEVQRRLATTSLVLVGTGLFGATTYDLLARSGATGMRVIAWDDDGLIARTLAEGPVPPGELVSPPGTSVDVVAGHLRAWAEDADIVITATRDAPAALCRAVNRICLSRSTRWLRGNADGSRFDIGPFVLPHESGCYRCLELRQASMQDFAIEEHLYQEHLATEHPAGEWAPVGESLWTATLAASFLVGEAIRVATGLAAPTLIDTVLQLSPVSGALQPNHFRRVPRCPDCYRGEVALPPIAGPAHGPRP
jgi:bacteriocin biosynthesis cyclodehydratase domain-containing protein